MMDTWADLHNFITACNVPRFGALTYELSVPSGALRYCGWLYIQQRFYCAVKTAMSHAPPGLTAKLTVVIRFDYNNANGERMSLVFPMDASCFVFSLLEASEALSNITKGSIQCKSGLQFPLRMLQRWTEWAHWEKKMEVKPLGGSLG